MGRESIRLQIWLQDLLTHAADAKDKAGRRARMLWRRSSFISENNPPPAVVLSCLASLLFCVDEDDEASSIRAFQSLRDYSPVFVRDEIIYKTFGLQSSLIFFILWYE